MALIKSSKADQVTGDVIVLDLGDLRRQAETLKAEARREAAAIVARSRVEAEQARAGAEQEGFERGQATGYQQGLAEGREAGRAEALAAAQGQFQALQAAWANLLGQWEEERRQMLIDARQSLLELAVTLAGKIVHRHIEVDEKIVAASVAEAVDFVARPADVTIRIHPEDRAVVAEALPAIIDAAAQVQHAELVDDASIDRGGCVITYGRGRIDATITGQLERLARTLLPDEAGEDADTNEKRLSGNPNDDASAAAPPGGSP